MKTKLGCFVIALMLLASLAQTMRAAIVFTVSPGVISNTYNGPITLSVTGLTNTETVVVQKFLDANTNNVIDAGDTLWQQFNLTDGTSFVIGGVTNINVPGDTDGTANGQITAKLNFQADFAQTIVGKYLFKLSSPGGHFTPMTNSFTVTNFPFAQKFTGTVASSGVAVPNAVVILFQGSGKSVGSDGVNPIGGAVANNSGSYTIQAAAGTYLLAAFKTNFIADTTAAAGLVLGGGATINTNLSLLATTRSITGKFVASTSSSIGLPGLLVPFLTQSGLLAVYFTDTNGNFSARVNASQWQVQNDTAAIAFEGYVAPENGTVADTTAGNVSLANIQLHKGTALFFGTVKDNVGNPLPMVVPIGASDNNNGLYDTDGYTDTNGNYVTAVVGGLGNNDPWEVQIDNTSSFPNYIFSQSALSQNGGTNMTVGKVVQQNFTAILATNHITGHVQFTNAPVAGVQVNAEATINGVDYNSQMDTDSSGNYSLKVPNGDWNVTLFDCCDDDSLDNILGSGNYVPPGNVDVIINNNNGTANFTVIPISGPLEVNTTSLPSGSVGVFYSAQVEVSGGTPFTPGFPYGGYVLSGSPPPGLGISDGDFTSFSGFFVLSGTPTQAGTFPFVAVAYDADNNSATNAYSVTISPLLLSGPTIISGGQFKFLITGVSNQNYTVQMSTNLSSVNWTTLFVTNNSTTNSFLVTDPNATNDQRFYRILIGP